MLVQQLISKVDSNRNEAANAVVAIAAQCSDAGAIEDVIKILFGLLKGKRICKTQCQTVDFFYL